MLFMHPTHQPPTSLPTDRAKTKTKTAITAQRTSNDDNLLLSSFPFEHPPIPSIPTLGPTNWPCYVPFNALCSQHATDERPKLLWGGCRGSAAPAPASLHEASSPGPLLLATSPGVIGERTGERMSAGHRGREKTERRWRTRGGSQGGSRMRDAGRGSSISEEGFEISISISDFAGWKTEGDIMLLPRPTDQPPIRLVPTRISIHPSIQNNPPPRHATHHARSDDQPNQPTHTKPTTK